MPAMNTDSATPLSKLAVVWKDSPGVLEKQLRFRQSFQSARPISGSPCGPRLSVTWRKERTRWSDRGLALEASQS